MEVWSDGADVTRRTRYDQKEVLRMGYNVACNPIGPVPNSPLASAAGN